MTLQERIAVLLATAATLVGQAHALPQGPQTGATSGAAPSFTPGASTLTVDQTAQRAVIDWNSFAIAPGETVTFNMPSGTAIAVNRVPFCAACSVPPPATVIDGALVSNGNVWVLDPRGVFFGPNAQVDVHGLLASPADLLDVNAFVNGALGDPIAFGLSLSPGPLAVQPGAQIVVRGGPAMFVGAIDPDSPFAAGVNIAGAVTGGGTAGEQATSQVLYGAAQRFTLRFSATPPNAMGSSDLQLFDFIVDTAVARTGIGAPVDAVTIGETSVTRAGSVFVAGAAGAVRDPANPDDPVQFRISGPLESTSGPLIVNGAGGIAGGAASGALAQAEIDVLFDRAAFQFLGPQGPQVALGPLVDLRAAGGMDIAGRSVRAFQRPSVGGQFPTQPVPDHATVQVSNTSPSAAATLIIRARADVFLQNAATAFGGPLSRAADLSGASVTVMNSLGSPTFGNVFSGGAIVLRENIPVNGGPAPATPVDFAFATLTAGLTQPGAVTAVTRGGVKADAIVADDVMVRGNALVALGAVTAQNAIDIGSLNGPVSTGTLAAPFMTLDAGAGDVSLAGATGQALSVRAGGDVAVSGAVFLAGGAGPPALQVTAGDAVTFAGAVTSQRDAFISAGGLFTSSAPIAITAATGASMTTSGVQTFGGFDLRAADVALNDTLFVRGVAGVGANLAAPAGGGIGLGDGTLAAGLRLSNAEVQRIDAPVLNVRGGLTAAGVGDVLVGDLTLDSARIGLLVLATGSGGAVRASGTLTGIGAPRLDVGEGILTPGRIEITGALGTLTGPLGQTALDSVGAILIGTPAFVAALQGANLAQVDLSQFGVGFGGAQANQLFLVSGATGFNAQGAILQQNTGGLGFDGVRFAVPPTQLGSGVFDGAPTRIALFGRVEDRGGVIVSGAAAASVDGLLANGVNASNAYRVNGCIIGQVCASAPTADFDPASLKGVPPPRGQQEFGRDARGPASPQTQARRAANGVTSAIEVDDSASELESPDEAREERDPGVGAANEDLWPTTR